MENISIFFMQQRYRQSLHKNKGYLTGVRGHKKRQPKNRPPVYYAMNNTAKISLLIVFPNNNLEIP
jgi:hypothetical protein